MAPSGAMQSSRLLTILLRLQAQGRVSAGVLAESFEVSVRTIYRDVDALSAAGVPVYAEKGRHGGFALREGYRTRLTGLDRPEAESLFLAGAPFAAQQLGLGPALETTRLKLLAALPESAQRDAERVASRFHLDPVAWFQGPDEQRLLPTLAQAVWAGRMVQMRYERWQGVVGAARGATRSGTEGRPVVPGGGRGRATANLPRRLDPDTCRGTRVRSHARTLRLAAPTGPRSPRTMKRACRPSATVRARPDALRMLARSSHAVAQAVVAAGPPNRQGWQVLDIPIESVQAAVGELLRLGPDVQVLEPAALRRAMRLAASALHAAYRGRAPRTAGRPAARGTKKKS